MNKELFTKVTPAILPKTFEELEQKLSVVAPLVAWVQVDAADGLFVPNKTWPYAGDPDGRFMKIIKQEEGFPFCDEVSIEVDLMVANPVFESDKWIAAGASRLVIHIRSIELDQFEVLAKNIKEKGIELILGVEIDVPLKDIHAYAVVTEEFGGLDGIQCMGIRREGFQHEKFDKDALRKVAELRDSFPGTPISVDGGVSIENAASLHEAGATRLVCGSSIFDSAKPAETVAEFEKILEKSS